jgi:hypothetical protein
LIEKHGSEEVLIIGRVFPLFIEFSEVCRLLEELAQNDFNPQLW